MNSNELQLSVKLSNQDVAYIMEILNRAIQGREAARLIVPIMDKIEAQSVSQMEEIAFARKEAEKKLNEVQPEVEVRKAEE